MTRSEILCCFFCALLVTALTAYNFGHQNGVSDGIQLIADMLDAVDSEEP